MQNRILSVMNYEYKEQMSGLLGLDFSPACPEMTGVRLCDVDLR